MNLITIIGNLTRDPVLNTTQDGTEVCHFTVAVSRKLGKDREVTDFFDVSVWRGLAEICQQYLAKGRKVAVTGSVTTRGYLGKDGTAKAQMQITANGVEFLTTSRHADAEPAPDEPAADEPMTEVDDDELPF